MSVPVIVSFRDGATADLWMNLQLRWDLYHVQKAEAAELRRIRQIRATG